LNLSIGRRLALGFLIPALIATLTLGSVGTQSQQRFLQEATFYQNLLNTYNSLTTATNHLEQMHSQLLQTVTYAAQPDHLPQVLSDEQQAMQASVTSCNTMLTPYLQQDLIERYPDLVALFTEAGHTAQIEEQQTYSESTQVAWQAYCSQQAQVLAAISSGHFSAARTQALNQANEAFADTKRELHALITFSGSLAPSLRDAAAVEVQTLLFTTVLSGAALLLGIAIVGWLISSTLVRRLQRLRTVAQDIANGQVDARLEVAGHDEIADVSRATNRMVDTLVGLLEETRQQRDELTKGEELKRLHEALQQEHEALNDANTRLEAMATRDPLTGLPNHRTVMGRIEEELSRCARMQAVCAILFLDIDHFKHINDTRGHRAGDAVLYQVSQRLREALRLEDFVGRYGGEEFAIVLTNTGLEEARHMGERVRAVLAKESCLWQAEDTQSPVAIPVTCSIGIAVYQEHGTSRETLIEAADSAMYLAKRSGRNRVCVAGEEILREKDSLIHSLTRRNTDSVVAQVLLAASNAHDRETSEHALRMVKMAEATAVQLGCSDEEIHLASVAALLHDIGKIGIPDHILQKPGPLTDEERAVMRHHPKIGYQILAQAGGGFEAVSHIVVAHHERWDGEGYPYGLSHEDIPLGARILAVVDSYDAMTSDRPYRKALPISQAQAELRQGAGSQFDPRVVEAFIQILGDLEHEVQPLSLQAV